MNQRDLNNFNIVATHICNAVMNIPREEIRKITRLITDAEETCQCSLSVCEYTNSLKVLTALTTFKDELQTIKDRYDSENLISSNMEQVEALDRVATAFPIPDHFNF